MRDHAAMIAAELGHIAEFERRLQADGRPGGPEIDCLCEPDPHSRHLLFLLRCGGRHWLGRKLLERQPSGPPLPTSRIAPHMLLGEWEGFLEAEDGMRCHFRPADAARKRAVVAEAADDPGAELSFPFALLDEAGREIVSPPEYWSGDPRLAAALDEGEVHLREYTARLLGRLALPAGGIVYDPACSTGTFLASVKEAAPGLKVVGSDLSAAMVALARPRLDDAFVADAATVALPEGCTLLVLRFLNAEVLTVAQAEAAFRRLSGQLRAGAHAVVFGHTSVLAPVGPLCAELGFDRLRSIGATPGKDEIFQYYVLRRR
ncbi:class I SAM-dependent methyltransferase [Arenibaculum sp.]|uniref:class I SAM-dependent methyltransferase n=1 Tax=Arenibaculum sp. TaxID=2865862 RepID=UPI002E0D198A|nr:class I SAM-dependent methyltransferase [Arenibaculum sp.]